MKKKDVSLYFLGLATDFDGSLAHDGVVDAVTLDALERFKPGRRLILVTGRELSSIKNAFSRLRTFDRVVAENGAVVYDPITEKERQIALGPNALFVERLKQLNVAPLSIGRSIIATRQPYQRTVLHVIQELGLELQIIFNKDAVMVLPPGVNKAAGRKCARVGSRLGSPRRCSATARRVLHRGRRDRMERRPLGSVGHSVHAAAWRRPNRTAIAAAAGRS